MDDTPNYYKFYADSWQVVSSLPKAKAAKLLYAMHAYFFDGVEPAEGELPAVAQRMFDMHRASIASYRRNALNGTKNRQNRDESGAKTVTKPTPKATPKTVSVLKGSNEGLPAETQKVGYKHSGKHSGKSASNIINHKSISITTADALPPAKQSVGGAITPDVATTEWLDTMGQPPRAPAGAAQGRPAAALPSRAEYDRVSRMLGEGRLEELTERDREIYHAGHKAYATNGYEPE